VDNPRHHDNDRFVLSKVASLALFIFVNDVDSMMRNFSPFVKDNAMASHNPVLLAIPVTLYLTYRLYSYYLI
jgi:hypothetical protein